MFPPAILAAEASDRGGLLRAAERAVLRGERRLREGDAPRAVRLARRVLDHEPSHVGALELLGRALLRTGDAAGAAEAARRLIAMNPYEPGYHSLRGLAMREMGLYGESAKSLRRDPAAVGALRQLGRDQSRIVSDLLKSDARFARAYAVSPSRSLRARGFAAR